MAREYEAYRDILADICESVGKRLLNAKDVAAYLGIDPRTAKRRFAIGADGISAPALARKLAAL